MIVAGCGARSVKSVDLPNPYLDPSTSTSAQGPMTPGSPSMSEFIAKVRALTAQARPPVQGTATHIEAADPRLAAAIARADALPSPETLRQAAEEYQRHRIADKAHDYLRRALALDPRDWATYDALARLWRDSGLPELALADGHRAVYYAPASAAAHNTLGTVLQALGQRRGAHQQYERALELDPKAAYALSNICYDWILDREPGKAVAACEAALKLDPSLSAAQNNLGLAHAARGDIDASRGAFQGAGDKATALYNMGIVYMARRQYTDAVTAFAAAQQARPSLRMAAVRAEQARKLAAAGAD
jgi:tetratricopeptide (TPR) repeat protein